MCCVPAAYTAAAKTDGGGCEVLLLSKNSRGAGERQRVGFEASRCQRRNLLPTSIVSCSQVRKVHVCMNTMCILDTHSNYRHKFISGQDKTSTHTHTRAGIVLVLLF